MTPSLTVNLLRVLFVTFCGAIGGIVTGETQGSYVPGLWLELFSVSSSFWRIGC